MKTILNHSIPAIAIFILCSFRVNAQDNNLAAGDIAFVSFNSDPTATNKGSFSVLVLKETGIPAGTIIYFTDNGWSNVLNDWLYSDEGYLQWTVPAGGVALGAEIYFSSDLSDNWSVSTGTLSPVSSGVFELTFNGDQVICYQTGPTTGPASTYLNTTRRFIGGIHANVDISQTWSNGWDLDVTNVGNVSTRSAMPPGLTGGASSGNTAWVMTNIGLPTSTVTLTNEPDNGKYNCAVTNGTVLEVRDAIYKIGSSPNWTYSNSPFPAGQSSGNCTYFGAPRITAHPSNSSTCAGTPISFTVAATGIGTFSYQWQESADAGFTSPVTLANTGIYSNVTTTTLAISDNTTTNGKYYRAVVTNASGGTNSNGAAAATAAPALPTGHVLVVHSVSTPGNLWFGSGCTMMSQVVPSGADPISGNVAVEVWRESSVLTYGQPYVQRHYQVTPSAGTTGTVTFYFSQQDFDNFNAHGGSFLDLPTGPGDVTGISNLRITKFNGSTGNGTGLPGSYSAGSVLIDPNDANIVWNATDNRWEVTIDVTGFSGFFVQTSLNALPVNLISFSAQKINNDIQLKWQTADETNNDHFELERSLDGRTFTAIGQRAGMNGTGTKNYEWNDAAAALLNVSKIFYRLKIVSTTGNVEYSNTVIVSLVKNNILVTGVAPNPFKDKLDVNLNMPENGLPAMKLTDMTGRILRKEYAQAPKGFSTHTIRGLEKLSPGVYFLSVEFEGEQFTFKIKK